MAQVESDPGAFTLFWEEICDIVFNIGSQKERIPEGWEVLERGVTTCGGFGGKGI